MNFPPEKALIRQMVQRLKAEAEIRKTWPGWSGGTVFLEKFGVGATLRPDGGFDKIFFTDGEGREYFKAE